MIIPCGEKKTIFTLILTLHSWVLLEENSFFLQLIVIILFKANLEVNFYFFKWSFAVI